MRRTDRKELYFEIIERVWNRQGRVSYKDFCEALIWARAHMSPDRRAQIHIPSQPTFSRYWRLFKKQQRIRSCSTAFIRDELLREMTKGSIDPELPWDDLLASIHGCGSACDGPTGLHTVGDMEQFSGSHRMGWWRAGFDEQPETPGGDRSIDGDSDLTLRNKV